MQAKPFWTVTEHLPRERAAAGINAFLAAKRMPDAIRDAFSRW